MRLCLDPFCFHFLIVRFHLIHFFFFYYLSFILLSFSHHHCFLGPNELYKHLFQCNPIYYSFFFLPFLFAFLGICVCICLDINVLYGFHLFFILFYVCLILRPLVGFLFLYIPYVLYKHTYNWESFRVFLSPMIIHKFIGSPLERVQ